MTLKTGSADLVLFRPLRIFGSWSDQISEVQSKEAGFHSNDSQQSHSVILFPGSVFLLLMFLHWSPIRLEIDPAAEENTICSITSCKR